MHCGAIPEDLEHLRCLVPVVFFVLGPWFYESLRKMNICSRVVSLLARSHQVSPDPLALLLTAMHSPALYRLFVLLFICTVMRVDVEARHANPECYREDEFDYLVLGRELPLPGPGARMQ